MAHFKSPWTFTLSEFLRQSYAEDFEDLQALCEELLASFPSPDTQPKPSKELLKKFDTLMHFILEEDELTALHSRTLFLKGALHSCLLSSTTPQHASCTYNAIVGLQEICQPFDFSFD